MEEEDQESTETLLRSYYDLFVNMSHPMYHTIKNDVEEDAVNLRDHIDR